MLKKRRVILIILNLAFAVFVITRISATTTNTGVKLLVVDEYTGEGLSDIFVAIRPPFNPVRLPSVESEFLDRILGRRKEVCTDKHGRVFIPSINPENPPSAFWDTTPGKKTIIIIDPLGCYNTFSKDITLISGKMNDLGTFRLKRNYKHGLLISRSTIVRAPAGFIPAFIAGRVVDRKTNNAIPNVKVEIAGKKHLQIAKDITILVEYR